VELRTETEQYLTDVTHYVGLQSIKIHYASFELADNRYVGLIDGQQGRSQEFHLGGV